MISLKLPVKRESDILHGPLTKNIFFFALSLAATGILQQLFNAADVAVVGRYVGKDAMAAVGSNGPIVGLIVNMFVGVSLGSNVVIARLTGMGKFSDIKRAVDVSLIIALVGGVAASIIGEVFASPILDVMGVPPEVRGMAEAYLRIYLAGIPLILVYNFEAAIFRSQGDSFTPLVCLAISGGLNVVLNLFFVIVVGMTADGVALATIISNGVSALILFIILTHTNTPVSIHPHKPEIDMAILKRIFVIGLPAGLQSAMFSISNICVQSAVNGLGSTVMAASSAAFNIEIVAYYIVNAFGQACTTFIGQNYGAGNMKRCRTVMRRCLIQDMTFTIIASGGILLMAFPLLRVFNTDPTVVEFGYTRLRFLLYAEGLNVIIEIFSGAMRGYGNSLIPAMIALGGICGVRILWVFTVFTRDQTFSTLLWCYPLSWAVTAFALIAAYFIFMRKINKAARLQ